jgi:hypothetical protein
MYNQKTIFAIVAVVAAIGLAAIVATSNLAYAKITSVDTSCTNSGGHHPKGQQPTCTGSALTQETENQNPAGHTALGHNNILKSHLFCFCNELKI